MHPYLIAADAIPGLLALCPRVEGPCPLRPGEWRTDYLDGTTHDGRLSTYGGRLWTAAEMRYDAEHREVQHAIADVLRSLGHEVRALLPRALGGEVGDAVEETACPNCFGGGVRTGVLAPHPLEGEPCANCAGTGKIRRTVPAAEASAALLAASVAGVVAGRGVVRGVLPMWTVQRGADDAWESAMRGTLNDTIVLIASTERWCVFVDGCAVAGGPETGPAGRAAADAAALALGWALLDPSAPSGVGVPTWGRE